MRITIINFFQPPPFRRWSSALLLLVTPMIACKAKETDRVLLKAEEIARVKYGNFVYGDNPNHNEVNCVQFVGSVVEALLKRPLTKEEINAIYIRGDLVNLARAVESNDKRTKGIVYAITDTLKAGREICADKAAAGDFVQYWMQKADGAWMGHSAIISQTWRDQRGRLRAEIFGAHQSINGIGFTKFSKGEGLALEGKDRKVYLARLDPELLSGD